MFDFGTRLKEIRQKRGLTQKALAKRISKSVSAVSSYELNTQIPPVDVLSSIASVLNVSLDYLAGFCPEEIYTTKNLTQAQKDIIRLLYEEFSSPTAGTGVLSPQQIKIIQALFAVFSSKT